jgi:hypothetical protein
MSKSRPHFYPGEFMPLTSIDSVDAALKTIDGWIELVITDVGEVHDPGRRMSILDAKLKTYVRYVESEEFQKDFGTADITKVRVKIVYSGPEYKFPVSEMTVKARDREPICIPIVFEKLPF